MTDRRYAKLQNSNGTRQTGARWALSTLVLAVLLAVLAIPAFASQGELSLPQDIEARATDCTTWPDALARFHRAKPINDPANGAWSLVQAELYVTKYGADPVACTTWSETLARFHGAKPVDDPANGAWSLAEAEFYVAKYGADLAACTTWSEALARFHRAKPINDPANGAWSLAEAEFYVAKYGTDSTVIASLEENALASLCDAETSFARP